MYPPPLLQHKENRELSERLHGVEKSLCAEREKQSSEISNLVRSEQEARTKAGRLPSLLEQLSFLQHELETTQREKEELEEQTKVYKEDTQRVGQNWLSLNVTLWASSLITCCRIMSTAEADFQLFATNLLIFVIENFHTLGTSF